MNIPFTFTVIGSRALQGNTFVEKLICNVLSVNHIESSIEKQI